MSLFTNAMDIANTAFKAIAGETFQVTSSGPGILGSYTATSVDDLAIVLALSPGGLRGDNTGNIFVDRDVISAAGIKDGSVLVVRAKRVRVIGIHDDGDNTPMLTCGSAGVNLR